MKGFKRLFCLLLCALTCISASPFGMGVFAVECAHTYENVVENGEFSYYGCSKCGTVVDTLPVIFFSDKLGDTANNGFTDEAPVKTIQAAFEKLAEYGVGGTAVLCGQTYIKTGQSNLPDAGDTVTVTSVYNNVDYRQKNTACVITVNPLYFNSDVVFDYVDFIAASKAKNWYLQYNDLTVNDTCAFYANGGSYTDANPPKPSGLSNAFGFNVTTGYTSDATAAESGKTKELQTVIINCNGFNVLVGNKVGSTTLNSFGHKTGTDSSVTGLPEARVNIFIGEGASVGSVDLSPVNDLTAKVYFADGRTAVSYQQYTGGAFVTSSSIADYSNNICYLLMDMESDGLPAPEETVHVIDAGKFTTDTVEKRVNPVPYPALRVPFITSVGFIENEKAPVVEFGALMATAENSEYIAYQSTEGNAGGIVGKSVCYDIDSNDYVYAGGDTPVTFYGVLEFDKGGYEGKTFTAVPYAVVNSSSVGGKYTLIGASVDFKYNENATDEPGTDIPDIEDPDDGEQNDKTFDEENIVLSFGAISDVHIEMGEAAHKANFTKALNILLDFAEAKDEDGLDAVVVAGDMISNNSKNEEHAHKEINRFSIIVKEFANSSFGTNVLVTVGNHDSRSELSKLPSLYNTYLGAEYFAMDVENDLAKGYRHAVINDYHFIIAEPLVSPYGEFDEDVLEWIDETLAKITAENPDQYVFFVTHPTVANTVYGSEDDFEPGHNRWRSLNLGPVLKKYPQVVTFSGHTHSPIFDERCIMQTEFTAVNTGSTANTAFELDKYENMVENTLPVMDNSDVSTGLMVQADANGNVKITRIMFSQNAEIKEAWYLEAPNTEGSHLEKYTRDGREAANEAPVLTGTVTAEAGDGTVNISFPAGTDDDFVHHYTFTVKDASGEEVKKIHALTDFFCVTDASKMLKTFTYDIALGKGSYTVDIKAVDCWDAESGVISTAFEIENDAIVPEA
ncbi:MAG: metallophosphoesterase [Ruminococcaceae bacterium]|nr:metallophosphoesterase [Oscillospiraceae bacterium]